MARAGVRSQLKTSAKREAFIGIQQGHTIATEGYGPSMVRTGYDSVLAVRAGEMFARAARQDGEVIEVSPKGIKIKYKDGTVHGFQLGTVYGKAEGSMYPHPLVTDMKVGQKFKKDEIITYNKNFFQRDEVLPGGVVYKGGLMARIALVELPDTHEDSSAISEALSKRFRTTVTKPRNFMVKFTQNVFDVVQPGKEVRPEDILLTIEDEITSGGGFSGQSLEILSQRSRNSPKADYQGKISRVDILYYGNKADMTPTLRELADKSDRARAAEAKAVGLSSSTGYVDGDLTIDGTPIQPNTAYIQVYLDIKDDAGSGDKLVWGNQIKSVVSEVMPYTLRSEDGNLIDAKVGAKSFAARIVRSFIMIGVRSTTLDVIAKSACKAYRGK